MMEIMEKMVETQERLNCLTIGENWHLSGFNFCLAISQECAEGIDHLGYKWWAKQEPNYEAAQGEAVDVMHFALSKLIVDMGMWNTTLYLNNSLKTLFHTDVIMGGQRVSLEMLSPISLFSCVSTLAGLGTVNARAIFALSERLGLPFPSFARLYFCKAVLNMFRQEHGYRVGAYKKIWNGREDNTYLKEYSHSLDWTKPEAPEQLYRHLSVIYVDALANA